MLLDTSCFHHFFPSKIFEYRRLNIFMDFNEVFFSLDCFFFFFAGALDGLFEIGFIEILFESHAKLLKKKSRKYFIKMRRT